MMNKMLKIILGFSFSLFFSTGFAQQAKVTSTATAAEIEQMKKKTLANIESIKRDFTSAKKYLGVQETRYKNLQFLATRPVRKKYCNSKLKAELKASGSIVSGSADKKATEEEYDDKWYACMEEELEKSRTQLNDAARLVWDAVEDVKKIEQTYISAIKYYNSIPGAKALAVPAVTLPKALDDRDKTAPKTPSSKK